jgi:hypothetical protein
MRPGAAPSSLFTADLFTQPSLSTLVEGVELLAGCFHP